METGFIQLGDRVRVGGFQGTGTVVGKAYSSPSRYDVRVDRAVCDERLGHSVGQTEGAKQIHIDLPYAMLTLLND